ncbi:MULTISPECIES: hypothetical protein [unclassified Chelatococcus]|uniref:hypothetical protein n=1 Tax=unclassified Chelatococcus TaxID=2638111 RepID=UPI001BCDD168|nr:MULTISPECIES: hypothetical protein [unclassified Chelatococcus]MBS7697398.1 hypothetical protein [Chelatococcus sp. YT9]MBX3559989.1 hypothetical protein [Chelatococcus sp.]
MSKPSEGRGRVRRGSAITMILAAVVLIGAGLGVGKHAAASPSWPALAEGSGGEAMLVQAQKKKKKKVYRNRQAVPQQCRPWCPRDTNPCDPPDFKIADGRCDWRDEFW